MRPLDKIFRSRLERVIREARDIAEDAARVALEQLGVGEAAAFEHLSEQERELRRRLRVHGRQLGDALNGGKLQTMDRLIEEVAYEHWHRMLFARFLAENDLLMYPDPDEPVAVTLEECEDLAGDEGAANGWELAARFAARMLPQIFRLESPVFQLALPPEHQQRLERLVADLPQEVFTAADSLGWVYQFWQAKKKDEVNASEVKIGARELPAVTQLFTEPYMVSFLLDNSLGAWWAGKIAGASSSGSQKNFQDCKTEEDCRKMCAIPGVPLDYLRFVARASSSGSQNVTRASSSGSHTFTNKSTTSKPFTSPDFHTLRIHGGENLPHWQCENAIYHVSFRLSDSVPEDQRNEWLAEREAIENIAVQANRPLTEEEEQRIRFLYSKRIEAFLDSGYGECHLQIPEVGELLAKAIRHFDGERYRLHAWCLMPNHVHVIVEPAQGFELASIIHTWKSFTANKANQLLGRSGPFWQEDAYTHILRTEKDYRFQVEYVFGNPAKAGLRDWKWVGPVAAERPDQDGLATIFPDQDGLATTWAPAAGTFDGWPEELSKLKLLDPCCGSGHFLVAAFHMLVPMRMARENLSPRKAADAVLRENIHGLELDQRCVELAAFALALAAWKYPGAGGYRVLPELNIACSGLSVSVAKEEWKQLGLGQRGLTIALDLMHDNFRDAPVLGSLLNPAKTDAAKVVHWEELAGALEQALQQEQSEAQQEVAVVAQGLAKAAILLAGRYHLVITNVPYLARGKHDQQLREYCEKYYTAAKNDLATVFLDRCLELCAEGAGTVSAVLPQNWLFLTTYKRFREKLLKSDTWHLLARLGEGGFDTSAAAGAFVVLLTLSRGKAEAEFSLFHQQDAGSNLIHGLDVSAPRTPAEKAAQLQTAELKSVEQAKQLENPDARVAFGELSNSPLLDQLADYGKGSTTGDGPRFLMYTWEFSKPDKNFVFWLNSPNGGRMWTGRSQVCKVPLDDLGLNEQLGCRLHGQNVFGRPGVVVNKMRKLEAFLYYGEAFDDNICPICPAIESSIPALFSFVESNDFHDNVRVVDQSLKVTAATLTKVPFDLDHWTKVAEEKYPNGLPKPYTDDPTQWIFHGHPCGSVIWDDGQKWTAHGPLRTDAGVLQVAVARLLGYRWPAELDPDMELADEQRAWVNRCPGLTGYADGDGIVCIPPVRGEVSASDRLLNLLAAAYEQAKEPQMDTDEHRS
ncbi:MAG TPA: restriction endonuclease subunit M, partial [Verrucomicrobia bacterium]|nr:restriction endonuclease subunit M [Verrucomicrobiota bacterium]